jgi:hypothetical protein
MGSSRRLDLWESTGMQGRATISKWRKILYGAAISLAVLVTWALPVCAQNSRGTILGHVQDTSGGPIPGVKVTVENTATGVRNQFRTAEVGDFVFVDLVPGTYKITVEKDGFKTATSTGLILEKWTKPFARILRCK